MILRSYLFDWSNFTAVFHEAMNSTIFLLLRKHDAVTWIIQYIEHLLQINSNSICFGHLCWCQVLKLILARKLFKKNFLKIWIFLMGWMKVIGFNNVVVGPTNVHTIQRFQIDSKPENSFFETMTLQPRPPTTGQSNSKMFHANLRKINQNKSWNRNQIL